MNKKLAPFSISKRLASFKHAIDGIKVLIKEEHNARIHLLACIVVIILGFLVTISLYEWLILLLTIAMIFTLETINAAIENLCDFIHIEEHQKIKKIKDLSSGAVLIAAIIAILIGGIIFLPKLVCFF